MDEIVKIEREEGQVHFYITGDTHRSFDRIEDFCYEYETTTEWYAGHYHVECEEGGVRIMFEEYDEIMQGEIMENYVYLIGIIQPYGELSIMGIYTDEKLVIEAYDKLINEDGRCMALEYPEEPEIYKIPLNKFLGEKVPWAEMIDGKLCFYAEDNIENLTIDQIRSHVKSTSF